MSSDDKTATIRDGEDYIQFLKRRFENINVSGGIDSVKFEHQPYIPYDISKDIITFGDIHGDLRVLVECLKLAGCIDKTLGLPDEKLYEDIRKEVMNDNKISEGLKEVEIELKYNEEFNNEKAIFTNWLKNVKWVRSNVYVVQLGDMIDRMRKPDNSDCTCSFLKHNKDCINNVKNSTDNDDYANTLKIYAFITVLNDRAVEMNSKFIPILGNHEFLNVQYNFKYVSMQEAKVFQYVYPQFYPLLNNSRNNSRNNSQNNIQSDINILNKVKEYCQKFEYDNSSNVLNYIKILNNAIQNNPKAEFENNKYFNCNGSFGRIVAYTPGQLCSNWLAIQCVPFLQIGEWVFVHGGLTINMFDNSLSNNTEKFCKLIRKYLLGINLNDDEINVIKKICSTSDDDLSIFMCRTHSSNLQRDIYRKTNINKILTYYNKQNTKNSPANIVVVAHTPQFELGLNLSINNNDFIMNDSRVIEDTNVNNKKVWKCDVAMSRGFNVNNFKKDIETINNLEDININNLKDNIIDSIIKLEINNYNNPLIYHSEFKGKTTKTTIRRNPLFENNTNGKKTFQNNNRKNTFEKINGSVNVKNKLIHVIANKIIEEFKIDRKKLYTNGLSVDIKYGDLLYNIWSKKLDSSLNDADNTILLDLATKISNNQSNVKYIKKITDTIIEISRNIIQKFIDALNKKYSVLHEHDIIKRNPLRYPQIFQITRKNTTNSNNPNNKKRIYTCKIMHSKAVNVHKIDNPNNPIILSFDTDGDYYDPKKLESIYVEGGKIQTSPKLLIISF